MQAQLEGQLQTSSLAGTALPQESAVETSVTARENLTILRNIKIGTFHIGSSLADILATGVWNRIMIKELGFAATPIALLLALRYFLAPFSIWVGARSDRTNWHGYRRLPYVWGGRLMMALSYVLLGVATLELAGGYDPSIKTFSLGLMNITVTTNGDSVLGWLGIATALIMFCVGSVLSSTTFLSLIYDTTPPKQRTRAVSVVWFFLILGFAVAGIFYSRLLPEYTRDGFLSLFLIAPLAMMSIWVFSVIGEEKPIHRGTTTESSESLGSVWGEIKRAWQNPHTQQFFLFLTLSTIFFYMQDVILEPFAGEVFNMPLSTTNRFSGYWGSMTLLGIVVSLFAARRWKKTVNNTSLSRWGVLTLIVTFILFVICAAFQVRGFVTVGLITMGIGLGMWTVGSLGLMMDMTRAWGAGLYLALWTVASTLARGAGVASGGILLDFGSVLSANVALAYAFVFGVQVVGFVASYVALRKVNVEAFKQETAGRETVFAATMD
ncbi:MAG: BCD family MFS transporter [Anaerolineae bacterium]